MEKDAFYFPHFSNARLDRKIKRVRKELGIEGYGIYFMILETLRDQENFSFPIEDIDLLADEFGTSEQKLRTVISNYALFELDENDHFFSPKLLVFLQPYLQGKEKRRIGGIKGNLIRYGHITKEQAKELSDAQILDLSSSLEFKSAFKSLPEPKASLTESLTESDSDRFISQSKVNSIQYNTSKFNKSYKEKNTKKENQNTSIPYTPKKRSVADCIPDGLSLDLSTKLLEFITYRKKIRKPIKTERPILDMVNSIGREFKDEEHLIFCIDFTMLREWKHVSPDYIDYNPTKSSANYNPRKDIEENPEEYKVIGSLTEELAKKVKSYD